MKITRRFSLIPWNHLKGVLNLKSIFKLNATSALQLQVSCDGTSKITRKIKKQLRNNIYLVTQPNNTFPFK